MTSAVLPSCVNLGAGSVDRVRGEEARGSLSELKFERLCVTAPCAGCGAGAECSCCSCRAADADAVPDLSSPMPSPFASPLTPARAPLSATNSALSAGSGQSQNQSQHTNGGGMQLSLSPNLTKVQSRAIRPQSSVKEDWLSPNGGCDSGTCPSPTSSGVFSNGGSFGLVSPAASCALETSSSTCAHSPSSPQPPSSVARTLASPSSSFGLLSGGGGLVSSPSPTPSVQCQTPASPSPSVPAAVLAIARQTRARLLDGQERHSSGDLLSGAKTPDLHLYRIPLTCLTGATVCQLERLRPPDSGSAQHFRHRSTKS